MKKKLTWHGEPLADWELELLLSDGKSPLFWETVREMGYPL